MKTVWLYEDEDGCIERVFSSKKKVMAYATNREGYKDAECISKDSFRFGLDYDDTAFCWARKCAVL